MSEKTKIIGVVIASIVASVVIISGGTFLNLWHFKFFAPKFENAKREVFEKTRSYNQAKMQELAKYRLEYLKADDENDKYALASTIRHRFADYDDKNLPDELRRFLEEIRGY